MRVSEAVINRSAKRAFLPKPVPREIQKKILETAAYTPSGANMQPWVTYAVSDEKILQKIGNAIIDKLKHGAPHEQFIQYYPIDWKNPYKIRRVETGVGLYSLMGVKKEDTKRREELWHQNYRFFGAKTVFFVFTDKAMIDNAQGALLDCGAYMQSIMLSALELGVQSCPQASTTEYGKVIAEILGAPENLAFLYSIVLGYEDKDAKINSFKPKRAPLSENVVFM